MMTTISLRQQINPHFYKMWNTNKPYVVLNGGRGSFKSSVVSLKLCVELLKFVEQRCKGNVICIMDNISHIKDAVYSQIQWALDLLGVADEFYFRVSPMTIMHRKTGNSFHFYGADDPMKLKSNKVTDVIAVWFEEFANMKSVDVFDQSVPTFIRNASPHVDHVTVYVSYNPPKNPYDWINEWVTSKENDDDYLIDHSTYLDDELGFTTPQTLKLIEGYKANDYDYYRWLYLGEVVGLGTNVYNIELFNPLDKLPDDQSINALFYSVDTGHEVSATTCGCYGLTNLGNVILLDTYYYSPQGKSHKKPPSELAKDLKGFIDKCTNEYGLQPDRMTIDSAEGALDNQFYNDYGVHWHKVNKLKNIDMVDRVQDLLAQGRFYYLDTDANKVFIEEHKKYQWDENTLQSDDPKVVKVDDHTVDQFKYFVRDNERQLGLKW
ncbi:PBSX family phage terminase large subunit [Limosilactobacillus equigenerosi]|nr:PBSX family phage terminase large subunit [Limosilactobacillus equigenerosi]